MNWGELNRDVNSREIAFPGRESQFPGLHRDSRFRPSTYLLPTWSVWDGQRGREGGNCRLVPDSVPGRCGDPIDWSDRHSKRWCTRNVAKRPAGGSATGEVQWPIGIRTVGRGIIACPRRMPLDSRSTSRADRRAKWRAVWPCLRRHGARVETQAGNAVGGDAIADWPPDAGYGKSTGPPSDVAGRSFPIEADWSGHICTAGPMQWHK